MALSEEKIKACSRRLLLSRMRILLNNGFYGLLLMHMILAVDEECATAATDGRRIYFSPKFLDEISDSELDFVMMHEILHVVLMHCERCGDRDENLFNAACDIVVNSNILLSCNMELESITLKKYGESIHLTPNKDEGYEYTAEEVYKMLRNNSAKVQKGNDGGWDDHSRWTLCEEDTTFRDVWCKRAVDAAEAIEIQESLNLRGRLPLFAKRLLNDLRKPQTDWKTILAEFVQEEICDYSFSPPDRRFGDSPFFLPDFNGTETLISDILFMVDTSASMSDEMVTAAFSEVKGAIEQFDGKLKGWLGFFDTAITEPITFETIEEFEIIRPEGGGGTDFQIIFEYVHKHMQDKSPVSIIILTDGYALFPDIAVTDNIPVLWLLNNEDVEPPWGKVARIKV